MTISITQNSGDALHFLIYSNEQPGLLFGGVTVVLEHWDDNRDDQKADNDCGSGSLHFACLFLCAVGSLPGFIFAGWTT